MRGPLLEAAYGPGEAEGKLFERSADSADEVYHFRSAAGPRFLHSGEFLNYLGVQVVEVSQLRSVGRGEQL